MEQTGWNNRGPGRFEKRRTRGTIAGMSKIDAAYPGPGALRQLWRPGRALCAAAIAVLPASGMARDASGCASPSASRPAEQAAEQAGGAAGAMARSDDGPTGEVIPPRRPSMRGQSLPDPHADPHAGPHGRHPAALDVPEPERRAAPASPGVADTPEDGRESGAE